MLDISRQRGKKKHRAATGTVFSTTAELFVKLLCTKKQESRLQCPVHVWHVLHKSGAVPCILEHHLLASRLLNHCLRDNKDGIPRTQLGPCSNTGSAQGILKNG